MRADTRMIRQLCAKRRKIFYSADANKKLVADLLRATERDERRPVVIWQTSRKFWNELMHFHNGNGAGAMIPAPLDAQPPAPRVNCLVQALQRFGFWNVRATDDAPQWALADGMRVGPP